jgi:hypothetical protein
MTTYLISKKGFFFEIDCPFDASKISCEVFDTLGDMYFRVSELVGLSISEIEGCQIYIDANGIEYSFNGAAHDDKIENIELYVDEWEC